MRKTARIAVPVFLLVLVLGGALYGLRRDEAPETAEPPPARTEAGAAEPAPLPEGAGLPESASPPVTSAGLPEDTGPAERTDAPPEVRSRSLASLRGSVSRALRSCAPRLTGGPVRVFVSMDAVVGGGRIQPAQVRVRTSSPTNGEFVRCVSEAVQSVSVPAAAGEPEGSFPATVSLLSGGP